MLVKKKKKKKRTIKNACSKIVDEFVKILIVIIFTSHVIYRIKIESISSIIMYRILHYAYYVNE